MPGLKFDNIQVRAEGLQRAGGLVGALGTQVGRWVRFCKLESPANLLASHLILFHVCSYGKGLSSFEKR